MRLETAFIDSHVVWRPLLSRGRTLVNIRNLYKTLGLLSETRTIHLHFCRWWCQLFIQIFVVNSENTSILKRECIMALQDHPRSCWQKSHTRTTRPNKMIKNNNLGHILHHFRVSVGFLLKTALHSYSIRILGCSQCRPTRLKCWISEMLRPKAN